MIKPQIKIDTPRTLPEITDRQTVARSNFFRVEEVSLCFSNGQTRRFERMAGSGRGAVMVVGVQNDHFIIVREYAAGTHSYQLGFPKGLIDPGETPQQAANRELQEEAGFAASDWQQLGTLSMAPTFFDAKMHVLIAHQLAPNVLEGDEPEPLDVFYWPIADAKSLLNRDDFVEARSVAALYMALDHLSASS